MPNPGLPDPLWERLDGGLWHATDIVGLRGIVASRQIGVAVGGRHARSFCRTAGGLCLFDFGPSASGIDRQFHNWVGWLGHQQDARIAVWLKIGREKLTAQQFWDAEIARQQWNSQGLTFIPGVEACHIGPLPVATIDAVLLIARDRLEFFREGRIGEQVWREIEEFEQQLPPPPNDAYIKALNRGRDRVAKGEPESK